MNTETLARVTANYHETTVGDHSTPPTVLLLANNYLSHDLTRQFIQHLNAHYAAFPHLEVAITDNNDALTLPPSPLPVHIYHVNDDLGYMGGCYFALERWRQSHGCYPDWLAIANTDVELAPHFFQDFLAYPLPEEIAVVGPDVLLPTGMRQSPFYAKRPSRWLIYAFTFIYRDHWLLNVLSAVYRSLHGLHMGKQFVSSPPSSTLLLSDATLRHRPTYAIYGCLVFFRRRFFELGGTLCYGGYLWKEELHIAEQARRVGVQEAWIEGLRIVHYQGTSSKKVALQKRRQWSDESAKAIWEEYFA